MLATLLILVSDSLRWSWTHSLVGTLNISQAYYANWREGGANSLAFVGKLEHGAQIRRGPHRFEHGLVLAYGQIKQDSLAYRKSEDQIRWLFHWQYLTEGPLHPTFSLEWRTQFAPGYDYRKSPPPLTSRFLAPAFFTQALGITYAASERHAVRLSLALRQTIVRDTALSSRYGLKPGQRVRWQPGMEIVGTVNRQNLLPNVQWTARMGIFSPYERFPRPIARWENELLMRVNKFLHANVSAVLYYDRDLNPQPQLKEVLALGFSYTFW
ncbi:MAG: DUF3078 domain-containing protein [Bacteroidota bacterium]|nr:DUF3078 domain-containing protein [Rhodothermia bacterium]MDW8138406.1 DUF3078 domain-containing protein [Bacteroidota bacterium]MDW8284657.1 DUF3078 domain-containing protein [Bacteroidota bacterium]